MKSLKLVVVLATVGAAAFVFCHLSQAAKRGCCKQAQSSACTSPCERPSDPGKQACASTEL